MKSTKLILMIFVMGINLSLTAQTIDYIAKYNSSSTFANSVMKEWNGRIGVGNTNPTAKMHVQSGADQLGVQLISSSAGTIDLKFYNTSGSAVANILSTESFTGNTWGTNSGGLGFFTGSSFTAPRMLINSNGNIGIGNIVPDSKLHINAASAQLGLQLTNSNTGANEIKFYNNAGSAMVDLLSTDNYSGNTFGTNGGGLAIFTGGSFSAPRMLINSSGNVGIGTISPGTKLEVNGQVKITGGTPGLVKY